MITTMFVLTTLVPNVLGQRSAVDARAVLTQAVSAATRVKNDDSRDEVLTAIARVVIQSGMSEEAMRAAQQMKQPTRRAAVAAAAARKHYENADWQSAGLALTWFLEESRSRHWYGSRMQLDYSRASSSPPDRIAVNRVLALAARGEFVDARDLAMRIADRLSRYEALHGIVVAQLEFGDIDGAESTVDRIPATLPQVNRLRGFKSNASEFRGDGLRRIAVARADRGDFDKAFQIADSIESVRFRESAVWSVAERHAAAESEGIDPDLLSRYPIAVDKLSLYGLAVQARMKRGDEPGAQGVLGEAMSISQPLPEPAGKVAEIMAGAMNKATSGGVDAALKEAQGARDAFERSCMLLGIAKYLLSR